MGIQDLRNLGALLGVAELLAHSSGERELILAHVVAPSPLPTRVTAEQRELERETTALDEVRAQLSGRGIDARAVAFLSPDVGKDLVRLSQSVEADLILLDGRRPLLVPGPPRGAVGHVLHHASCDVAVLVERESVPPRLDSDHPVLVPFGGAPHDWAAVELGARIAAAAQAPLELLGAADPDAGRVLADAALAVQRLSGVQTRPVLVQPEPKQIVAAAGTAGLLVIGLSERWHREGLGPIRSAIAAAAAPPTLFVRRGPAESSLAPPHGATRFGWSHLGDDPP